MKKDIHPKYRDVVFQDVSAGENFVTRSTVTTKDTIELDGKEYPLVKLAISSASHPFFTGKQKFIDTAGRIEKFQRRYKIADESGTDSVIKVAELKAPKEVSAETKIPAKTDAKAEKQAEKIAAAKAAPMNDAKGNARRR